MKPILEQLQTLAQNYATLHAFLRKHAEKLDDSCFLDQVLNEPTIYLHDPAAVGEAFGTSGWTRIPNYNSGFDWQRTVDGVRLRILNAEENTFMNSAVPPSAFPLALQSDTTK